MTPTEVGFDGAKGINLNLPYLANGGIFRLRRGPTMPDTEGSNFRNNLVWVYPEGEEAKLVYCNSNNELFELAFIPLPR
jgi:hypothetical protein